MNQTQISVLEWEKIKSEHLQQFALNEIDDELLVMGCLAGDDEVWAVLVERYAGLIYTIARNFNFPATTSDEIFQDVCLLAIRKMDTLQDRSKLHAWLVTITKRLCLQRKRKASRTVLSSEYLEEIFSDGLSPEQEIIKNEAQSFLDQALSLLDDRCRYMIEALFLADPKVSYDEVAEVLSIAVGSVGPIRNRCLDRLRRHLVEIHDKSTA